MKTKCAGFSLIELVVAIAIGGVILATVMGSYLSLARMRQSLDVTRQIQREVNFAAMRMGDRMRAHSVNYEHEDYSPENHEFLPLGEDEFVYDNKEKMVRMNGAPLFSPSLEVSELRFEVIPSQRSEKIQGMVKLELRVSSKAKPEISVPLRTTISSRIVR